MSPISARARGRRALAYTGSTTTPVPGFDCLVTCANNGARSMVRNNARIPLLCLPRMAALQIVIEVISCQKNHRYEHAIVDGRRDRPSVHALGSRTDAA